MQAEVNKSYEVEWLQKYDFTTNKIKPTETLSPACGEWVMRNHERTNELIALYNNQDTRIKLSLLFTEVKKSLSYYLDAPEDTLTLLSLWIIGSYFHEHFPTYPILYFNAMRGSGKTRALNCIAHLALGQPGKVQNNISESALFHSKKEVLCIDEFEPKATERNNLILLLNSCYKRGSKVRRMKKVKTTTEESHQIEEHDLYIPVALANIGGLDHVLQDRALIVYLEKSFDRIKSSRIEDFADRLQRLKAEFVTVVTQMTVVTQFSSIINGWNRYLDNLEIVSQPSQPSQPSQHDAFYKRLFDARITGRSLEIAFPLLIVASLLDEQTFNESLGLFSRLAKRRRESEMDESHVVILRFIASLDPLNPAFTATELFNRFQLEFSALDLGLSPVSFSRILDNHLHIIKRRERTGTKRTLFLDIQKAKSRIGLFDAEVSK